jgi:hypothetical protein
MENPSGGTTALLVGLSAVAGGIAGWFLKGSMTTPAATGTTTAPGTQGAPGMGQLVSCAGGQPRSFLPADLSPGASGAPGVGQFLLPAAGVNVSPNPALAARGGIIAGTLPIPRQPPPGAFSMATAGPIGLLPGCTYQLVIPRVQPRPGSWALPPWLPPNLVLRGSQYSGNNLVLLFTWFGPSGTPFNPAAYQVPGMPAPSIQLATCAPIPFRWQIGGIGRQPPVFRPPVFPPPAFRPPFFQPPPVRPVPPIGNLRNPPVELSPGATSTAVAARTMPPPPVPVF